MSVVILVELSLLAATALLPVHSNHLKHKTKALFTSPKKQKLRLQLASNVTLDRQTHSQLTWFA